MEELLGFPRQRDPFVVCELDRRDKGTTTTTSFAWRGGRGREVSYYSHRCGVRSERSGRTCRVSNVACYACCEAACCVTVSPRAPKSCGTWGRCDCDDDDDYNDASVRPNRCQQVWGKKKAALSCVASLPHLNLFWSCSVSDPIAIVGSSDRRKCQ